MDERGFAPNIVVFACNWCSYAGLDLAGTSRIRYPPNLKTVRVMCSGRIEPSWVLRAFRNGADGVLVTGCHPRECHYLSGNYKTRRRMLLLKRLLRAFGLADERLRIEWISASEGERFAAVASDFTEQVRTLGPTPLRSSSGYREDEVEDGDN